jgi:cyclic pyranopterin monophosphate synthase
MINSKQQKQCAGMVDISHKEITVRRAVAEAKITLKAQSFKALMGNQSPKGNVFETAKIAGIMAAKSTPSIIPLCHPLNLEKVKVHFEPLKTKNTVVVTAEVLCSGKTGVEMEALAAVSAACLTIYDMMKWAGQDMVIGGIQLKHKSGGKTGVYQR